MNIIIDINQLVTVDGKAPKTDKEMDELNTIKKAYLIIDQGKIYDYGKMKNIQDLSKYDRVVSAKNKAVLPGFIDPHTHFVFGGDRSDEFKMRLKGVSYLEILKKGGGILNTVKSTREASFNSLVKTANHRLDKFLSNGVTTLEGKSGYGLDKVTEIKQLKVMKELDKRKDIDIVSTFLGAHAVLKRYKNNPLEYIYHIIENVLPEVKSKELAEFCDVFC
ncbi:MAG: imidazolonepropionase, partial [Halanaerobiales bacterium]|nr:imidazolonepropionase [Halanaerobiales bacterium]